MNSDEFGQAGPVRIRPRKSCDIWAFLDRQGNSDSFAAHFVREQVDSAFSPSTARTAPLPNDPIGRLWWI
jgi:hypothetical protein